MRGTADTTVETPAAARSGLVRSGWIGALRRRIPPSAVRYLGLAVLALLLISIAAELHRVLRDVTLADIGTALANTRGWVILAAFAASALSYCALVGYEHVALRQVGVTHLRPRFVAVTAFISYSFTFVLGFGVLTGGAVRLRRYRTVGLAPSQILAVTLLGAVSFWIGLALVAAVCVMIEPSVVSAVAGLPRGAGIAAGAGALVAVAGWSVWHRGRSATLNVSGWTVRLPDSRTSAAIVLLGMADILAAALALWLLLPADIHIGYPGFLVVFALATVAGVVSHVPGGLGAFEAVILLGLPSTAHAEIAASLILFRLVYYLVPFAFALVLFVAGEVGASRARVAAIGSRAAQTVMPFVPRIAGLAVFGGGVVLLLSGAAPAEGTRLAILADLLPLPFVETSHFLASVVGAALLVVSVGLLGRRRASWQIAVALVGAGAVFSLFKGLDVEEAAVCTTALALLLASRRAFYRGGGAWGATPSWPWICAMAVAIGLSVWLGFLAYRSVDYSRELWWRFALDGDASRFLRGTLGAAIVLAGYALYRVVRAPSAAAPPGKDEFEKIAAIVGQVEDPGAQLALLGDKSFLISGVGTGFVMYGVEGKTVLAMGDPVADDPKVAVDLIWRFRELADRCGGDPAFYEVGPQLLPHYIDAGFSFAKLGEVAIVDLAKFSFQGSAGAKLRQAKSRAERAGLGFRIVPAAEVPSMLPQLRAISDAWLAQQKGREKGFSLGFWSDPYIERFDQAVIEHDGRPIAFANIWRGAGGRQVSIDLMRHVPDMPNGTMDAMFISLMEAAKAEGAATFNLGLAPMSGMPDHSLAPAWSRFARLIYEHGNQFYNFRGLRAFKAKFRPDWQPRYLAYTGPLAVPRVLMDATRLISRGPGALQRQD
ncbi:bifunctional lysylphosphatidylglycerol flippase/synthetase MprF [Acuticoccus sediminis]|uniref:Bifunctional lysylphosphatidylglycerol flippase/synthetase MprF n=1 Tax=Acuticoccus sediminis TaxID=2184697 RepID=A0A8B2NYZ5_9HYPH|nr:bifunctional lysylphosphatidylglycerol flippase/synthetase MprF [Acuticoccus sediminis]RAI01028.1 bifunctional lysylphosphatidylglycerol flippase/synthetase MprF [Acuticoccus sediminis]